ncbi:alpha-amylase family protein [Conexibacter stalactiti]|uniref:Alpha-L-fucosidase n=1 Tax=Conexibacter stalactiti TaxID=1940611 RepID=A0ABU4HNG4_9ACTN|nr:alpha-amylase family protein [Conexibacter stalactiti]MDW5594095.1 alpha-L-fucosidase [Conexibacter stalactiti]MEC5034737.1 alpha-amylase family protein [Conexibacter stalactiti]
MVRDVPAIWVDERLRALPRRPWRKVHLDFQVDAAVGAVGAAFDPGAFAATLVEARVDAIVVFAKNTQGYCFYPSPSGPVHPGLVEPDLLGKQVAACRAAGIEVHAYYSYAWDELLAERHPEWLVWRRDRTTHLPRFDEQRFWTPLCIAQPGLLDVALTHVSEVLERYPVDGIWFDMVFPAGGECYCPRCLAELGDAGLDPLDRDVQRAHKHRLHSELLRRLAGHIRAIRPDARAEYNGQVCLGLDERVEYLDNIDIEALPTGGWGYGYFPLHARYARTFGRSVYGMSGRFHTAWGDYGGLKHPIQLRTELAGIVAQGLRCDVGDQPLPGAALDAATYATIGEAYAEIERLEPWLEGAVPATEAAIVVDGPRGARLASLGEDGTVMAAHAPALGGLTKLMTECQLQFDVVDTTQPFERYRLVVLPDSLELDDALAARLASYRDGGGAVLQPEFAGAYFERSHWADRERFERLVARLLPAPLVRTSAPRSAEVTVTHQVATPARGERWIVHIVNYSPMRRGRGGIEYVEDPIPLHDVEVALAIEQPVIEVYEARTGERLALDRAAGRWRTTVGPFAIAAAVVFQA